MKKRMIAGLSAILGIAAGAVTAGRAERKKTNTIKQTSDKHLALFLMMNQWIKVKQEGKCLATYFEENGYKKIAIYGMSYAGERLMDELKDSDIIISYGIDRNADYLYADIDIVSIDEDLDQVDAVVVTAITFFDEIQEKLSEKIDCPIISLEDILYEI